MFFCKLDPAGNFVWAKSIGGTSSDYGNGIAIDHLGNLVICGKFRDTVDFDPGPASHVVYSPVSNAFILKLDANGNFIWFKNFISTTLASLSDVECGESGEIVGTGNFGGVTNFDPGMTDFKLTSYGNADICVFQLNTDGSLAWAKQKGGANTDIGSSITIDNSGDLIVTGNFSGSANFDPSISYFHLGSSGSQDIFVLKLNASGGFVWVKKIGGTFTDLSTSIESDPAGNLFLTGVFSGTSDFNPGTPTENLTSFGSADVFVEKLDSQGDFLWVKQIGGTNIQEAYCLYIDRFNDLYITGSYSGLTNFSPGSSNFTLTSSGGSDVFITKLNSGGNMLWSRSFGSFSNDIGKAICVDDLGSIITTGSFAGTLDFDPNGGVADLTCTGSLNVFIQKLADPNPLSIAINSTEKTILTVYPNPASDKITIKSNLINQYSYLRLLDLSGRVLMEKHSLINPSFQIDLSDQLSGVYIIELISDRGVGRSKVIKK